MLEAPLNQFRFSFRPRLLDLFAGRMGPVDWGRELGAGAVVGLVALPLALALGIASVPPGTATPLPPPMLGLLTAVVAGFLISALGGCRVQIGGPTAAFVPIVVLILMEHGYGGLILATMMAGVILIALGLARMGTLIKFIPWPVTSGFTTGIALALMLMQAPDFFGLGGGGALPHEFTERLAWLGERLPELEWRPFGVAAATLALILFWPRLKLKAIPGPVVAVAAATAAVALLDWEGAGGVATIGSRFGSESLTFHWPELQWPEWDAEALRRLIGPATAIALLGAIESLLSCVVADGLSGDRHDSNTELVAQGVANLVCPFLGGLPATGAIARTSSNIHNGARTPLAGMVHAAALFGIVLLGARWAVHIPMAAMAAVLAAVALRMGEWHELGRLPRMPRSDALVLLTTCGLTVVFDLVVAVEVGMVLAAILYIKRVSETTEVSRVTEDDMLERPEHIAQGKPVPEGVVVYRIFGPFLFGAAEKMEDALARAEAWPRVLILRLHLVSAMDATGLHALESIVERIKSSGGSVILSGIHAQPLEMLRKAGFIEVIGRANFCATFDEALQRARSLVQGQ